MKKKLIIMFIITLFFLSGCAFHDKQYSSNNFKPQISSGLIADLDIGQKVSGSTTYKRVLIFTIDEPEDFAANVTFSDSAALQAPKAKVPFPFPFFTGSDLDPNAQLKKAAAYNALKGTEYDYILNPRYEVKDENYLVYKKTQVTVTGWGLKVKKFRQVKDKYLFPNVN